MPAWYDIVALDANAPADLSGLEESANRVEELVRREVDRGVPEHRIVLAGFSQGGAVALYYLTRRRAGIAGVLALSTYLPTRDADRVILEHNRSIPVFMAHGTQDPVVPCHWGKQSAHALGEFGFDVQWREYPMQHSVSMDEIGDVGRWLSRRLSD